MALKLAKKVIAPVVFVAAACALAAFLILTFMYTDAYAVYIDDEFWGYVEDTDGVEEQVAEVEEVVGEIRNEEYTLDCNIRYESAFVLTNKVEELDNVYDYLYDSVTDIVDNYVLKVDDEIIGMGDYEELSGTVDDVKDQYTNENTVEVNIISDVAIEYETVPSETDDDIDSIEDSLTEVSTSPVVYLTQEGDTLESLLDRYDLTESMFFALNPDIEKITDEDGNVTVVPVPEEPEESEESEDTENTEGTENAEESEDSEIPEDEKENGDVVTIVIKEEKEEDAEDSEEGKSDEDPDESENADNEETADNEEDADSAEDAEAAEDMEETEDSEETSENAENSDDAEGEENIPETAVASGMEVMVAPQKATLIVETKDVEKHDETVRYIREVRETDELYEGETEIVTEGANGTAEVSEEVVSLNGTEVDRYETDREMTTEPVNEVIRLGTKKLVDIKAVDDDGDEDIDDTDVEEEPEDDADTTDESDGTVSGTSSGTTTVTTYTERVEGGTYYATGYMWPLQNYGTNCISSGYGWRYLNGQSEFHSGIDIAAAGGTPILASKAGTVVTNAYNSGRGWYIQIDHGDGFITLYQHMNAQSQLTVGTSVVQGQVVGYVGNTGYSFGNHLHFEVWTSGGTVLDPMTVFTGTATTTTAPVETETVVSEETLTAREDIVAYAESFLDCPYVYGGHGLDMYRTSDLISYANNAYGISIPYNLSTPADVRSYAVRNYGISIPYVFDCSGFTGFLYRHFGYDVPYTVEGQIVLGDAVPVDVNQMEPGDLIFFATTGTGQATHVGMYVGDGQYIHASSTYGCVMLDTAESRTNRPIVAVRRLLT